MDPDVSHGAKHKWQVEWNHRNWKTQHQTRIKIIHHLQHQLPFYTRQLMNVKRKTTRQHIKIQAGAGSARFVLFFPQPFPVSQSLPCSFNLASTHTHSPQLLSSPLFFCQSKDQGHAGSTCQSKARSAEEASNAQRDACTQGDVFTKLQTHSDSKHRSQAQAAELILIATVYVIKCISTVRFYALIIPMRSTTAKVSQVLVSTCWIK